MSRPELKHAKFLAGIVLVAVAAIGSVMESSSRANDEQHAASMPDGSSGASIKQTLHQIPEQGHGQTVDLGGGVTMRLVYIPGGLFQMGSPDSEREAIRRRIESGPQTEFTGDILDAVKLEGPMHEVELDGFWMGQFEVTVAQFRRFASETAYQTNAEKKGESQGVAPSGGWARMPGLNWRNPGFAQGEDHPVCQVSWNDAKAFCDWLAGKTAMPFRLPTEAEWEYACRAGMHGAYQWGDDPSAGKGWLNGADQTAKAKYPSWPCFDFEDGYVYTAPAGSFKANAFGLHDMHGSVWEWCADWYGARYYAQSPRRNPQGPSSGEYRMSRGGSWDYYANLYRCAARVRLAPGSTYPGQGFRVACPSAR